MKIIRIFAIVLIGFLWSCNEKVIEPDAIPMTVDQMLETPGYTWVNEVLVTYQPDTAIFNQIVDLIDTNRHKFVIFARASCSCPGEKKTFAQAIKILQDLNFPESKYEIYAMSARTNNNPYSNIVKLNQLPEVVIFKNEVPIYYMDDTLDQTIKFEKIYPITAEQLILEALKK
jgi:hypothetical protein